MKLSVIILTNHLPINPKLLESLVFVDEIVTIVDSSFLKTKPLPKNLYYRFLNQDFAAQRNYGLQKAKGDWVLFVDDDEYVSTELAREITQTIINTTKVGFHIPRIDLVYHQPLRHGETGRVNFLRLAKKGTGIFERPVHERWIIKGEIGEIKASLFHLKDHFVSEFIGRMEEYSPIDAAVLNGEEKPFSYFRLLLYPPLKFLLNYFWRQGLFDGLAGLFQAYLMSVQSLTVRIFQWQNLK